MILISQGIYKTIHSCYRLNNLKQIVDTLNIKLVVVDSIASLVRKEFDTRQKDGNARRAALLCKQATILKYIKSLNKKFL